MRVVITGATGNVGTSLVAALEREPRVTDERTLEATNVHGSKLCSTRSPPRACPRWCMRPRSARTRPLRPGLIFKRGAATGIRRLFAGPLLPSPLVRLGLLFVIPDLPGLAVPSRSRAAARARRCWSCWRACARARELPRRRSTRARPDRCA